MVEKHFHAIAIKVDEAVILADPQQVSQSGHLPGIVNEMGAPDQEISQVIVQRKGCLVVSIQTVKNIPSHLLVG